MSLMLEVARTETFGFSRRTGWGKSGVGAVSRISVPRVDVHSQEYSWFWYEIRGFWVWRSRIWMRSLYVENGVSSSGSSSAGSTSMGAVGSGPGVSAGSDGAALSWGPGDVVG